MRVLGFGIGTGKMKDAHGGELEHVRACVGEDGGEGADGVPVPGRQHLVGTWHEDGHTHSGF